VRPVFQALKELMKLTFDQDSAGVLTGALDEDDGVIDGDDVFVV
jgi:hypothetical protein